MSKERLTIRDRLEIVGAFTKGFLSSYLELPQNLPELSEEEAKELDDLILAHERVELENKAKPFTKKQRKEILKLWNYRSALSGKKDKSVGGTESLHIHHVLAREFGGQSVIENAVPLTRLEHCKVHYGYLEAYIRYRRGEKDAFYKWEQLRQTLEHEPDLDKEWRLYLEGRVQQRLQDIENWKQRQQ